MKKAKKVTLKQRAKRAGVPVQLVYNRMHDGWSEKKALSVPVRKKAKPKKVNKVEPKELGGQLWGTEAKKKKVPYEEEPKKVNKVEHKKVTPEEVSTKKAPSPLKHRVSNPLPIQKYEAKRNNKIWYIIAFVGLVIIAVVANT